MASLSKERSNKFRIHWKFKVKVGVRAGETIEGSRAIHAYILDFLARVLANRIAREPLL